MIRTICAVLLLMCALPSLAGDGAATPAVRMLLPAGRPSPVILPEHNPQTPIYDIRLAAEVSSSSAARRHVRRMEYLVDDAIVAKAYLPPYRAGWKGVPGHHAIRARAIFADGTEALSEPLPIAVAKRWCYPEGTRFAVFSPYQDDDGLSEEEEVPSSPRPLEIAGVEKPEGVVVTPVDWQESAPTRLPLGPYTAYRISGEIPDTGAEITLPIENVFDVRRYGPNNIRVFRLDSTENRWHSLPGEVRLSSDLYAVVSAKIKDPGTYIISSRGLGESMARDDSDRIERLRRGEDIGDDYKPTHYPPEVTDTEPPAASWVWPRENARVTGECELLLAAGDNTSIAGGTLDIYDGDRKVGYDFGGSERLMDPYPDGAVIDLVDFGHLVSGTYTLKATIADAFGNICTAERRVRVESSASAPRLTVNQPHYDKEYNEVVVAGTAVDDDGDEVRVVASPDDWLRLIGGSDGETQSLYARASHYYGVDPDSHMWSGPLLRFGPGENAVVVKAADIHGNETIVTMRCSLPLSGVCIDFPKSHDIPAGKQLSLSSLAIGGSSPETIECKYEVNDGTGWTLIRDYQVEPNRITGDEEPHCIWTAGPPGEYTIRVTARERGTTQPEFTDEADYTVTAE